MCEWLDGGCCLLAANPSNASRAAFFNKAGPDYSRSSAHVALRNPNIISNFLAPAALLNGIWRFSPGYQQALQLAVRVSPTHNQWPKG